MLNIKKNVDQISIGDVYPDIFVEQIQNVQYNAIEESTSKIEPKLYNFEYHERAELYDFMSNFFSELKFEDLKIYESNVEGWRKVIPTAMVNGEEFESLLADLLGFNRLALSTYLSNWKNVPELARLCNGYWDAAKKENDEYDEDAYYQNSLYCDAIKKKLDFQKQYNTAKEKQHLKPMTFKDARAFFGDIAPFLEEEEITF